MICIKVSLISFKDLDPLLFEQDLKPVFYLKDKLSNYSPINEQRCFGEVQMLKISVFYILFLILISPISQASTSSQDYYYTCMKNTEDSYNSNPIRDPFHWETRSAPYGSGISINSTLVTTFSTPPYHAYGTTCGLYLASGESGSSAGGYGSGGSGGPGSGTAGGTCGSYIDYNTLSLTEKIPIVGTNFNFVYSSNRGHRDREFRVDINTCSKDAPSGSTYSCDVSLSVAGKVYSQTVSNTNPQDTVSFFWDGQDSSNNKINFASQGYTVYNDFNTAGQTINVPVTLGFYDAAMYGLQGWTIDALHAYDAVTHTIHFGDGSYGKANVIEPYPNQYFVKSTDGSEIYRFGGDGRHTETLNGFTNKLIYSFSHNGSGHLTEIQDIFGKTVTIQRSNGKVISITSSYGLVTNVTTDLNGNISSVSTPGGKTFDMTYWNAKGLMQTFKKPGSLATQFTYDSFGNLTQDLNATGRSINLSSIAGSNFCS